LKEDQTPVTIADQESEKVIIDVIKKAFPDHGFLGEESGSNQNTSGYLWIIDPIDGTKNYTRQVPIFGTEIALMKDRELIVGVSNAPAIHELMYAEKGQGAYLNDQVVKVSSIDALNESYVSFGNLKAFEYNKQLQSLLDLSKQTRAFRGYGDFWSYHLLAQGRIDVVIEAALKIWDIAALKVIVEEAGGTMTNIGGRPITIQTNSTIATNSKLHHQIIDTFNHP
jgi:histidinol-phosphatase